MTWRLVAGTRPCCTAAQPAWWPRHSTKQLTLSTTCCSNKNGSCSCSAASSSRSCPPSRRATSAALPTPSPWRGASSSHLWHAKLMSPNQLPAFRNSLQSLSQQWGHMRCWSSCEPESSCSCNQPSHWLAKCASQQHPSSVISLPNVQQVKSYCQYSVHVSSSNCKHWSGALLRCCLLGWSRVIMMA